MDEQLSRAVSVNTIRAAHDLVLLTQLFQIWRLLAIA